MCRIPLPGLPLAGVESRHEREARKVWTWILVCGGHDPARAVSAVRGAGNLFVQGRIRVAICEHALYVVLRAAQVAGELAWPNPILGRRTPNHFQHS